MGMRSRGVGTAVLILVLGVAAAAQMGMRQPQMRGVWSPVVGSGAAYQMEGGREGKMEVEFAVVGTENVGGKPGYWLEMAFQSPREGLMVMKQLMVLDANSLQVKRMIMQAPGEEPMEMPMNMMMMQGGGQQRASADIRSEADLVGKETITTPAGTFPCDHYRAKDKSWDAWVTDKVAPYGMVKMVSKDSAMTLVRVVTNAKSRITGTPRKMDMMRPEPPVE